MKSAFELAMERLGGNVRQYTTEQKEQLADVDRLYDAKVVQAKFDAEARRRQAGDDAKKLKQIDEDLASEVRSLETKRGRKKDELRKAFETADPKP